MLCHVMLLFQRVGAGTAGVAHPNDPGTGKVLTGDLDSSLASLAQNLSINKGSQVTVKLVHLLIHTYRTILGTHGECEFCS